MFHCWFCLCPLHKENHITLSVCVEYLTRFWCCMCQVSPPNLSVHPWHGCIFSIIFFIHVPVTKFSPSVHLLHHEGMHWHLQQCMYLHYELAIPRSTPKYVAVPQQQQKCGEETAWIGVTRVIRHWPEWPTSCVRWGHLFGGGKGGIPSPVHHAMRLPLGVREIGGEMTQSWFSSISAWLAQNLPVDCALNPSEILLSMKDTAALLNNEAQTLIFK